MNPGEIVTVSTGGGAPVVDLKSIRIRAAVNESCRSVEFTVPAERDGSTNRIFRNFAALSVSTKSVDSAASGSGDLVFTGYIDRRRPKLKPGIADMTISARAKGQDAVDCSAKHDTGRFEKKTALQIAKELDIYGVGYSSDAQLDQIDEYQLTPGETLHREVERLCRDEALTLFGQADGGVKLWNADGALPRQAGGLIQGVNLFDAEADHNCANRHSHKHVRGHQAKGTGKAAHQIEAIAEDGGVPRLRRHIRIHDGNTDKKRAATRANNHRDRSAGNGLRLTAKTVGWRDEGGALWTPGWRVWVESPFHDIVQDMLIEAVDYVQEEGEGEDSGGTEAELALVDPRAYAGKGGGRNASGAEWGVDGQDAS